MMDKQQTAEYQRSWYQAHKEHRRIYMRLYKLKRPEIKQAEHNRYIAKKEKQQNGEAI
jgi:hypothetical protein